MVTWQRLAEIAAECALRRYIPGNHLALAGPEYFDGHEFVRRLRQEAEREAAKWCDRCGRPKVNEVSWFGANLCQCATPPEKESK